MMDFLATLRERDIQLTADGDQLRCNGPTGALTPALREGLRQHKEDILRFLRSAGSLARQPRAIVPLQPGGRRTPIFAIAGHNGDVFCFRALAQRLGEDQPFFGLQPPGLDGHRAPLTRLEDLAAYFASEIRAFRPDGPCVVAGYCAGGAIAFDLARQLSCSGAALELLALFGSPFPTSYRRLSQIGKRLGQTTAGVVRHARALASAPATSWRSYIANRLRQLKTQRKTEPAASDPVLAWQSEVGRATLAAIRQYRPGPFPGRVSLFWPSLEWRCGGDALRQWPAVAPNTQTWFGPPGCDGDSMLREPFAAAFADLFHRSTHALSSGSSSSSPALAAPLPAAA
jgi:thioesterase domain-containing protein